MSVLSVQHGMLGSVTGGVKGLGVGVSGVGGSGAGVSGVGVSGAGVWGVGDWGRRSTVLVGREPELAVLHETFKRVRAGDPAALLIGGEAGIGKTRLVEEFARAVGVDGAQVLTGNCLELGEEGLPFAPFASALRKLLHRDGPEIFKGYQQEFARLLPELGAAGPTVGADAPRGYLFELVGKLFAKLADRRPLVLVLEDLHWADRSTRDLIDFMIRSARTARTLLVITYRSDELHRGHPLRAFLGELDRVRGVDRLGIGRLDRDGTARILAGICGVEPDSTLVDNIHARTQGNPFFIEELAATAGQDGCCDMPGSLRDLLLARIDRLPEAAQRVLRIAAAGGIRAGHELLVEVAGVAEAELEEALRAAVAVQLLVTDSDGGYEFRHALVQEAVHDDLLPGERVRLHARYAEVIEARPDLVPAGRATAEVARHWYAARNHPRALVSAHAAARAAAERYAYAEASRLLERTLDLWEQVPDAAERLGMDHLQLIEEALNAAYAAGEYARAMSLTRAALAEVDSAAQPLRAAHLLDRRSRLLRTLGKSDGRAELMQAYELVAPLTDPGRIELLGGIAAQLSWTDPAEACRISDQVSAAAEHSDDPAIQLAALLTRVRACWRLRDPDQAIAELRSAGELARQIGDARSQVVAAVGISDAACEVGDYEGSRLAAAQGRAETTRFGIGRSTGVFLISNEAEALAALGRWDEADALCAETERLDPPGSLSSHWLTIRARLRLARGDEGAGDLAGRAVGYLNRQFLQDQHRLPLRELRIVAALAVGSRAEALAATREGLADPGVPQSPRYGWSVLVAAAEALAPGPGDGAAAGHGAAAGRGATAGHGAAAGRGATAGHGAAAGHGPTGGHGSTDGELRAVIEEIAGRLAVRYPPERSCAAQVAALLAGADPGLWAEAVPVVRADRQPYPLAKTLVRAAEAAAAGGDRETAANALTEAMEIATTLGAVPLYRAAGVLARRIGLRPGGHRSADPGDPGDAEPLTVREREVLSLVAEGFSNRAIAQRLFISPKTASVHVSRILAKLEVGSRGEAAAVARRLGWL